MCIRDRFTTPSKHVIDHCWKDAKSAITEADARAEWLCTIQLAVRWKVMQSLGRFTEMLYDASLEKDNCGFGLIAHIEGCLLYTSRCV